jgi:hypothetical protein
MARQLDFELVRDSNLRTRPKALKGEKRVNKVSKPKSKISRKLKEKVGKRKRK